MPDGAAYIEKQCFDDSKIEEIMPNTPREINDKCLSNVIHPKPSWSRTVA